MKKKCVEKKKGKLSNSSSIYLENLKIKYTEEQEEILFSDNKKLYKLDYKER